VNSQHQLRPGLPADNVLKGYRIWDSYFTPAHSHPGADGSSALIADIQRSESAFRLGQFEKLCWFAHVGLGTTGDATLEDLLRRSPSVVLRPLEHWPNLLLGMIQLNAANPASLDAVNRWLADGPMCGVYFPGGGPGAVRCTDAAFDPLVRRIHECGGVIMQHTWYKTDGRESPGESTPDDLATLASRYPEQHFICAHAGGEWEQGIRAVRHLPNVSVETSGFDATAGFVEFAVRELGAERVIFGSHLPSRSLGTELTKVTAAEITEAQKLLILGGNLRRLLRRE
jgi:predicted TIM-barrel fold metal-dependent hydrolase